MSDKATFDQLLNIPGVLRARVYVLTPPCHLASQLLWKVLGVLREQLAQCFYTDPRNGPHSLGLRLASRCAVSLHAAKAGSPSSHRSAGE